MSESKPGADYTADRDPADADRGAQVAKSKSQAVDQGEVDDGPSLMTKVKRVLVALAVVVVVGLILAAILPRWWAQIVSRAIDGRLTVGFGYGLAAGLVFTAVPVGLLWIAFKARERAWLGYVFLGLALLTALPNLMTLWVAVGAGSAAHAGQRIMDVDGPGFRGGTLTGAIIAAAVIVFIIGARVAKAAREKSGKKPKKQAPATS